MSAAKSSAIPRPHRSKFLLGDAGIYSAGGRNLLPPRLISAREHQRVDGIYSACSVAFGVAHGPPCQLERLFASVPSHLSGCSLPGHNRIRKAHFNHINKKTGHRIKYLKVDAHTGRGSVFG
jgi:hypothetical protein